MERSSAESRRPSGLLSQTARLLLLASIFGLGPLAFVPSRAAAQEDSPPVTDADSEVEPAVADAVHVEPGAEDIDIAVRIQNILAASGMFSNPQVRVEEGVVFLAGKTSSEEFRQRASDLANNTEDVALVVNQIEITQPSMWDFTSARRQVEKLLRDLIQSAPLVLVAIVLLSLTWYAAKGTRFVAEMFLEPRTESEILRRLLVRIFTIVVYLIGLYVVLRIAGLTRLAATVIGGTGLLGLIIGIAFRDIAENFLASLLISLQRPFRPGDVIEVTGHTGVVQNVTTRGTLLMTFEGNHVHIPNAIIYKNVVQNYSANPNTRFDFAVAIDYADHVAEAQEAAVEAVRSHSAVLEDPEPSVLVEGFGPSAFNLRIFFWVNTSVHSGGQVRSAVIRKVKLAFEEAGLQMPSDSHEILFPKVVPVQVLAGDLPPASGETPHADAATIAAENRDASDAEGRLESEAAIIQSQARRARRPDDGADLLVGSD